MDTDSLEEIPIPQSKLPRGRVSGDRFFDVPPTEDMLDTVFSFGPKNPLDLITLGTMAAQVVLFILLPVGARPWVFGLLFTLFRAQYNAGLGMLLKWQSEEGTLVKWGMASGIFDEGRVASLPWWKTAIRECLARKMGDEYNWKETPIEFNTWLVFRQVVDLVLLNDFTAYMLFAVGSLNPSESEGVLSLCARWAGGLGLVAFNYWVKADAHRVIKDFAWYWGDFFFLVDQSLTFDGVFEMAPHPMYSVGYAGYYGIALCARSYPVLFISLAAHAAQMAFLTYVENPHIAKTYGEGSEGAGERGGVDPRREMDRRYFGRDLMVLKNLSVSRSADILTVGLLVQGAVLGAMGPYWVVLVQAVGWRVFHTYGLGYVLWRQGREKWWMKRAIREGRGMRDAFEGWKGLYNAGLCMVHLSFGAVVVRSYPGWEGDLAALRHVVAGLLILLHYWGALSVHEVIGDFGWFYGDFFLDEYPAALSYTGIYRFLNNPEKVLGHAALWGGFILSGSWAVFLLTLFSQASSLLFLEVVEGPHMRRVYGRGAVRKEAGLVRGVRRPLQELERKVGVVRERARIPLPERGAVEEGVGRVVRWVRALWQGLGRERIGCVVRGTRSVLCTSHLRVAVRGAEEELGRLGPGGAEGFGLEVVEVGVEMGKEGHAPRMVGEEMRIRWWAPKGRSGRGWVGVYAVGEAQSPVVTTVGSRGRWGWVGGAGEVEGEVVLAGAKVPWVPGEYEVRYHLGTGHTVLGISAPVRLAIEEAALHPGMGGGEVAGQLLPYVRRVLGCEDWGVETEWEQGRGMGPGEGERIALGIQEMYGVELGPGVVVEDGTVLRLGQRVVDALRILGRDMDMGMGREGGEAL